MIQRLIDENKERKAAAEFDEHGSLLLPYDTELGDGE